MNHFRIPGALSGAVALLAVLAAAAAGPDELAASATKYASGGDVGPLKQIEQQLLASAGDAARRAEWEAVLVRMLAPEATFEARRFACEKLAVFGTEASLPALARLLGQEETVGIACFALAGQTSAKATDVLRDAFPVTRGGARLQIIATLGQRGDAGAVQVLAQLARDTNVAVACAAITALGRIPAAPARDAVVALRREVRPETAAAVASASLEVVDQLASAGDRAAAAAVCAELMRPVQSPQIRRGAFAALLRLDGDEGLERIRTALSSAPPDALLVPVAIARIPALKSADASKLFGALLPGLPPEKQIWMMEALAIRADADARAVIRSQAGAADPAVRRAALAAMGRVEDASAVPLLAQALAEAKSPADAEAVALALTVLRGDDTTDQALVGAMRQAQGNPRLSLIGILARRGARAAVPALLAEAGGSNPAAAQAAFRALAKIASAGDLPAVLEKLAALQDDALRADAENAAARAMARITDGPVRSQAVLGRLAAHPGVEARCSLLRLLPVAGDAASLAALQAALSAGDARVRETAVRVLAAWPAVAVWDVLAGVYQHPENDTHRALALRGLVRMAGELNAQPDAVLVGRYRQLLADARSDDDRKLILSVLAGVKHPGALPLVLPLLAVPGVRAEAVLAVNRIARAIQGSHPDAAREALKQVKDGGGKR